MTKELGTASGGSIWHVAWGDSQGVIYDPVRAAERRRIKLPLRHRIHRWIMRRVWAEQHDLAVDVRMISAGLANAARWLELLSYRIED